MSSLTPAQVMLAAAVVVGLATACQVVAPRLRIPSLVLLLPAGFALGVLAPAVVSGVPGPLFSAAVDLMVAVILFQGGMELNANRLSGPDHRIVRRLVWVGGAVTGVAASLIAYAALDVAWPVACMLGAIVIVSGPTVVTPILQFAGLHGRVRGLLQWEGTLLDPVGALVAVVVLQLIRASGADSIGTGVLLFLSGLGVGVAAALVGLVLIVVGGRLVRGDRLLGTQVLIGAVIVAAGLANMLWEDAGLLAALLMGMTAPRIAARLGASLDRSQPFFGTVVQIGIGVLFIVIASLVPASMTPAIVLPTLVMAVLLMVIVRPIVVALGTIRTDLSRRERAFMACMDPRGIVAVATASSVGPALVAQNLAGAELILPAAFIIVAVTVAAYGLGAVPVARALRLQRD